MWHSLRPWIDWVMNDMLPPNRPRIGESSVHLRFEMAGVTLLGPPIPWNADAVIVELPLRLPARVRQRADFLLRIPGSPPILAEHLRRDETGERLHRLIFRLPTPSASVGAEIFWKQKLLASLRIPIQSEAEYLGDLRLMHPNVSIKLKGQYVPAQSFVAAQCQGLVAAAVIRSSTCLAPLADRPLTVHFQNDSSNRGESVTIPLTSTQLAAKETLILAAPTRRPRTAGTYSISWQVGSRGLLTQRVTGVTLRRFLESIRLAGTRFLVPDPSGTMRAVRQAPMLGELSGIGPCFVMASRLPGAAGLLECRVTALATDAQHGSEFFQEEVLIRDGITIFAPGIVPTERLQSVSGFELRHRKTVVGALSFHPVPVARFNAEGAFQPPVEYGWSPSLEDELSERLNKLMGGNRET